jgi:hypothetical protein
MTLTHLFFKLFKASRTFNVPIKLVLQVRDGLLKDFFTNDWAAK